MAEAWDLIFLDKASGLVAVMMIALVVVMINGSVHWGRWNAFLQLLDIT